LLLAAVFTMLVNCVKYVILQQWKNCKTGTVILLLCVTSSRVHSKF